MRFQTKSMRMKTDLWPITEFLNSRERDMPCVLLINGDLVFVATQPERELKSVSISSSCVRCT
jgi:hypothetical protein